MKKFLSSLVFSLFFLAGCGTGSSVVDEFAQKFDKKIILPLYVYSQSLWQEIIDTPGDKIISIVNPDNGAGYSVEELYKDIIPKLVASGKKPIGYVMTKKATRDIQDVKDEIDRWIRLYPDIEGFFLDEVEKGKLSYYEEITSYIKSKNSNYFTVLNPGTLPEEEYFAIADLVVVYESDIKNYDSNFCDIEPQKSALIVYNTTLSDMIDLVKNSKCKYIYATDDSDFNPYDSLPSYFKKELDLLK